GVVRGFDSMFTTAMQVQNWGSFSLGLPNIPAGLTNLCGIASGHRHALALRNDGTVAAWLVGSPDNGQANVPPGLTNVVAVAGGFSDSLALKDDGTVLAWGKYGNGTAVTVPPNVTNVIALAAGDDHCVALKADGTLIAWGLNTPYSGATNVPAFLSNVVAISCGSGHTLALKADGTVAVWGGDSGAVSLSATSLVQVSTMGYWNSALKKDGTTVEWGDAYSTDVPKPNPLSNVVAIVTGYAYAEALKADGTLVGWGRGADATNIPPPLSNIVAFSSGDYHRVGLAPVNLRPAAASVGVSGPADGPLIISLTKGTFDPNGDVLTFRITSLPSRGALYQYAPSGLGDPITAPGTVVSDPSRVVFVPLAGEYGVPYANFSAVANDGGLDSAPATWTVSIISRPLIMRAFVTNNTSPGFALGFSGLTNVGYTVWRSDNLFSWSFLGNASQISPGEFVYTDYTTTNSSVRFYRIRSP
ncbi:MAG TPA: hypothetical protein VLT36_03460, partial [Candidatus Dormibacteraeota bacterium]|nr:hypothetical protein [Candidatus Dormibacteraeota bacterium]